MKESVSMIVMSHLSNAQELNGMQGQESDLHSNINFAKWLISRYPNTKTQIDANAEYKLYLQRFPIKKLAMANCG